MTPLASPMESSPVGQEIIAMLVTAQTTLCQVSTKMWSGNETSDVPRTQLQITLPPLISKLMLIWLVTGRDSHECLVN